MTFDRVSVLCLAFVVSSSVFSLADSATATIAVSATVRRNCVISTTALAFGTYDPVVSHATAPLDTTATVTIACTTGTPASIGLDNGSNASDVQRRLTDGASAYINYQIFQDSGRSTVWGNDTANVLDAGSAPSKAPRAFPVYARIPGGQDARIGSFSDSVVATVNF